MPIMVEIDSVGSLLACVQMGAENADWSFALELPSSAGKAALPREHWLLERIVNCGLSEALK